MSVDRSAAPVAARNAHTLKPRQLIMMGLGSAIGAGLFLGSGVGVQLAGPAVLLSYLVAGALVIIVMHALGEMAAARPNRGAFSVYAADALGPTAGATVGWLWWVQLVIVIAAEAVGAAGLLATLWPSLSVPALALLFMAAFTVVNLLGVRNLGEFEFWFAIIKIVAVIAMIVGGLAVLIAGLPTDSGVKASFSNWFALDGGVLPHGLLQQSADGQWTGLLMALVVVMFSFGGTELIGITAGETEDPRRTIPRATNGIIWRILVFYIGALGVIMAVVPWNTIDGTTSPFVQIFDSVGVHAAAGILNFVCLTAVMSVYNSGLYANSRMLYSLARQGNAPEILGKLNFHGVPVVGVLASAAITALAVVVVFLWPDFAFNYLMSIATIAGVINWSMIMVTEIHFRRRVAAGDGPG